ncbi:MAG: STAS domain-containing protein [Acidobacteriota bacterium]|nr:MAG: STAS domain-containing protein [Acidobacteriota bacterium]
MQIEVIEEQTVPVVIVGLNGRMDSSNSRDFEERMVNLIQNGKTRMIVDCAELQYISSAGLRVFLMAAKQLTMAKGKLVLASLNDDVRQVFNLTGFSTIFEIRDSREDALKSHDS